MNLTYFKQCHLPFSGSRADEKLALDLLAKDQQQLNESTSIWREEGRARSDD